MRFSEKIFYLRKKQGLSQEELAERLMVSRQAISRWEQGSAVPDAANVLQLSRLFGVTTDYLLNDDYESDQDMPIVRTTENAARAETRLRDAYVILLGLNLIIFLYQLIACFLLQSAGLSLLGTMFSVAAAVAFEWNFHQCRGGTEKAESCRIKFYMAAVWLSVYFPTRLLTYGFMRMYPRPYSALVFDLLVLLLYLLVSLTASAVLKRRLRKK